MSEEELQLHFTYEEKTPGSYGMYMALLIKQIFHKKVMSADVVVRIQHFVWKPEVIILLHRTPPFTIQDNLQDWKYIDSIKTGFFLWSLK